MAHCYYHALSSVRKWGGVVEDYLDLHQWFDQSKSILADPRHRALRHHAEGIFMLENLFGATLLNADGKTVPTRLVGEQHVIEDLGFIPSFADWARLIQPERWMLKGHPVDTAPLDASPTAVGADIPPRLPTSDDTIRVAIQASSDAGRLRGRRKRAAPFEAAHKERTHCIAAPSPSGREPDIALNAVESIVE